MAGAFPHPMPLSLNGVLAREHALTSVLTDQLPGDPGAELLINTRHIEGHDAVAAAALRMRVSRHLRQHERGCVTIAPPKDPLLAARLADILLPLPERAVLAAAEGDLPDVHYAVIPATQVLDAEDAHLIGESALEFCEALPISDERAGMIALAAMGLAEQAMHSENANDHPVVAAALSGRTRLVELAVIDSSPTISESPNPGSLLEDFRDPERGAEILPELLRTGRRDEVDVNIEILAGIARMRWRWNGNQSEHGNHFPGTCTIVRIGS